MRRITNVAMLSTVLFALGTAYPARAQTPAPDQGGGPMVVERVKSGFVAAPDFKITEFDHDTGALVGGYAGLLADQAFFIGGAGYWLANGHHDDELGYGGMLIGWTANGAGRIAFGARGLVGFGWARLSDDLTIYRDGPWPMPAGPRSGGNAPQGASYRYWYDTDFFVFEPQAHAVFRITDGVGIDAGVGYRVIGGAEGSNDRLSGVSGSIAIRFGGS